MIKTLSKWILRAAWLVWILVMLLLGIRLALDNTENVQVSLFNWSAPAVSLGFTLCMALLLGVILGWFGSTAPYLLAKQRAKRLEKQLKQCQNEVTTLRAAPLKT
jgi:uncharacterized integral membrane protein